MAGNVSSPFGDADDMAILNSEDVVEESETQEDELKEDLDVLEDTEDSEEDEQDEDEESDEDKAKVEKVEKPEDEPKDDEKLAPNLPTYGQIRRHDPEFFKKFPGIRDLIFRHKEYNELFPSLEDAKEAVESLNNYKAVEQNITSGDPGELLELLENYDTEVASKFTDSFLPTLAKTRPDIFTRVTQPYVKHLLKTAYKKYEMATEGPGLNKKNAILHVHEEIFGDLEIDKGVKAPQTQAPKDEKYENEKKEYYTRIENDFRTSTAAEAKSELNSILAKEVDPKGLLSEYDRKNITRDVLEEVDKVLAADQRHMNLMGTLWGKAKKSGWEPSLKDRIKTAYLSRVRVIIPEIARKARSEALQARRIKAGRRDDSSQDNTRAAPVRRSDNRAVKDEEIDWGKSSDLDILNDTPKRLK